MKYMLFFMLKKYPYIFNLQLVLMRKDFAFSLKHWGICEDAADFFPIEPSLHSQNKF